MNNCRAVRLGRISNRLVPNGTNHGLFKINFQYIWLLKIPDLSHLLPIWHKMGPNLTPLLSGRLNCQFVHGLGGEGSTPLCARGLNHCCSIQAQREGLRKTTHELILCKRGNLAEKHFY